MGRVNTPTLMAFQQKDFNGLQARGLSHSFRMYNRQIKLYKDSNQIVQKRAVV